MADELVLPDFTPAGQIPVPKVEPEYPKFRITPAEFKREIKTTEDEWKKKAGEYIDKTWDNFREWHKNKYGYFPSDQVDPHAVVSAMEGGFWSGKLPEFRAIEDWRKNIHAKKGFWSQFISSPKPVNPKVETHNRFIDYFKEENKKRFDNLTDFGKQYELSQGGIYAGIRDEPSRFEKFRRRWNPADRIFYGRKGARNRMAIHAYNKGYLEGISLNILDASDNLYGSSASDAYSEFHGTGKMIGTLFNYMLLNQAAAGLGLPKALQKVAMSDDLARGALQTLGAPKYLVSKLGVMGYANTLEAGVAGVTGGLVGAFSEGVRRTAMDFRTQDRMTKKEWHETVGWGLVEGFFNKYFVGLINDPGWWAPRFLGDAVFALGEQAYGVATGRQKGFDTNSFLRSAIQGHIMGEIQGFAFSPTREQLRTAERNTLAMRYGDIIERETGYKFPTVTDKFMHGNAVYQAWLKNKQIFRKPFSDGQVMNIVKQYGLTFSKNDGEGYDLFVKVTHPDNYSVKPDDYVKATTESRDDSIEILTKYYSLSPEQIQLLKINQTIERGDRKQLSRFLNAWGKTEKAVTEVVEQVPEGLTKKEWLQQQIIRDANRIGSISEETLLNSFSKKIGREPLKKILTEKGIENPDYVPPKTDEKIKDTPPTRSPEAVRNEFNELLKVRDKKTGYPKILIDLKKTATRISRAYKFPDPIETADDLVGYATEQILSKPDIEIKKSIKNYLDGVILNRAKALVRENLKQEATVEILKQGLPGIDPDKTGATTDQRTSEAVKTSNGIYSLLRKYADKSVFNTHQGIAYYMYEMMGRGYTQQQVAEIFNLAGIKDRNGKDITAKTINTWVEATKNGIYSLALNKKLKKTNPFLIKKRRYVNSENKAITDKAFKNYENKNRVTGLDPDLNDDFYINQVEEKGAYIIMLRDYEAVKERHGTSVGNHVLIKASRVLEDRIEEMNQSWFPEKQNGKLYLKNPIGELTDRFVLYSKNLSDIQFNECASELYRVLTQNFDREAEPEKVFAVTIHKPGGGAELITNFRGTDVIFTKDPADIVKPYGEIIDKRALLTSETPETITEKQKEDFIKDSPSEVKNKIQGKTRTSEPDAEFVGEQVIKEFKIGSEIHQYLLKGFNKAREKLPEGFVNFTKSIKSHADCDLTIWEGMELKEQYRPLIQKINQWSYLFEEVGADASTVISKAHGNFGVPLLTENQFNAYRVLMQFIRETESKELMRLGTKADRVLKEGIDFERKSKLNLSNILKGHYRNLTHNVVKQMIEASKDRFKYSKILVQHFGINPKDLVDVMTRLENQIYKPLDDLYREGLHGDNSNQEFFSRLKSEAEDNIIDALKTKGTDAIHQQKIEKSFRDISFDTPKGKEAVETAISRIDNERLRGEASRAWEIYQKLNPENLSYTHHMVLGHEKNKLKFQSQIQRFVKGEAERGEIVADPIMRDLSNRKIPLLEEVLKEGYEIGTDSVGILTGTLKYVIEKRANQIMAENFKTGFLEKFEQVFAEALKNKNKELIMEFFENEALGYFYLPSKAELSYYSKLINDINKKISGLRLKGVTSGRQTNTLITDLEAKLAHFEGQKERLQRLRNTYQVFTTEKGKIIMTPEARLLGMNMADRNIIAKKLLAEEQFIPMNWYSFVTEDRSNLKDIFKTVTERIGKLRAPNLTNWDGIYMSRIMHKGMRAMIFKNDYLNKNYDFEYQTKLTKMYDTFNRQLKLIRFYKPTIIAQNDMIQGYLANPAYIKHMSFGFRALRSRGDRTNYKEFTELLLKYKDTNAKQDVDAIIAWFEKNPGFFHRLMGRNNLFNKPVAIKIYSDALKSSLTLMNKDTIFGAISDDVSGQKNFTQKVAMGWKGWQNVTWMIDEGLRCSVARPMFERFLRASGDMNRALQDAADWTNMFMVEYSRMPTYTRQKLNRFFLVPTYRIQTWRMYKEMLKLAGSSVKRITGIGTPQDRYIVSENKWKQALFEISPMIRKVGATAVLKTMLAVLFGYGFDGIFDTIFGYRAKKYKWTHGLIHDDLEFLSMSTPLFQIEKFVMRWRAPRVMLRYNMAALPGLGWDLATNRNPFTRRKIITANMAREPRKALGQLGAEIIRMYMPVGSDVLNWSDTDVDLTKKIINTFGLGFFYKAENPQALLRSFYEASNRAKTPEEHRQLLKEFNYKFGRAYEVLFNERFKSIQDDLEEMRKNL